MPRRRSGSCPWRRSRDGARSTARAAPRRSGPSPGAGRRGPAPSRAGAHSEARVGQEEVAGYVEAGGDGRTEGKGGGLEEDGIEDG